ncbi:MAG: YqcC family protein [Serratia symbiotica]|nr:YqcC family protein [Serratia symbiotica]
MSIHNQVRDNLQAIEQSMRDLALWQAAPPETEAFASTEPFCVDRMQAEEWLQWMFLPRMYAALLEAYTPLSTQLAVTPYLELALKGREPNCLLLLVVQSLDKMLNKEP